MALRLSVHETGFFLSLRSLSDSADHGGHRIVLRGCENVGKLFLQMSRLKLRRSQGSIRQDEPRTCGGAEGTF